ncbi:MAG: DUF5011 domain-containing protein [Chitinispirillaceae bacterium]|nr:DUF5011 domain-containing protein [Chitinispirillaceae bacterium]
MSCRKWLLLYNLFFVLLAILLRCVLPDNPNDSSNTSVSIVLRSSRWNENSNFLEDTAGNVIHIGAAMFLSQNIDSIAFQIQEEGEPVFDTVFRDFQSLNRDTVWKQMVFYSEGNKIVTVTPYSSLDLSPVTAMISIIGKDFPVNHAPVISITGNTVITPKETCSLTLQLNDSDEDQELNVFISGIHSGYHLQDKVHFTWTAPDGFIGNDTVVFIVIDNGLPPMSDTAWEVITVTTTPHAPRIEVIGDHTLMPLETCSLTVRVSDEDSSQELTISMDGEPEGAELIDDSIFVWTIPADFTGRQVVTFTVEDNGVPSLSTSVEDTITVSAEGVNHAPQWDVGTLELTIEDTDLCTLELPTICSDEDGDLISYSLVSGLPSGDTVIENTYRFQATSEAIGSYDVRIVASDPESAADTLVIDLSVVSSSTPDTTPPTLDIVAPEKDSSVVNTSSTTVSVEATDESDIASVVCSFESEDVDVTAEDSIYSATVSGLAADEYNTFRFIATDASSNGNRETLFVTVYYGPTMTDKEKPVMRRRTPSMDSILISSSSTTISIVATDENDIASVVCSFGSSSPEVTAADSIYSATVTGLAANQFNTIRFIATDASSNDNRETLFVTIYYDPTMTDNVAPIFERVNGPISGSIVTSASVTLVYTITDDNGVEDVYWTLNGTRMDDLTAGGTDDNEYSFTATLRSPPHGNSIVIHAQDMSSNHNSGSETITLNYNQPPVGTAQTVSTPRATPLSITLEGTDPEDDPLSEWTVVTGSFHGAIGTSRPTFTYTPTGNYEGKDSLTFTVSDGTSTSAQAKVVITVTANNVAPSIVTQPIATPVDKGNSATFTATINSDVYPAPNYIRWVHNNTDTVSGATGLTLTLIADEYADSGNYKVVVRSSAFPTTPAVSNNVKLTVVDVVKPQITLNGSSTVTLNKGSSWTDPSATATDDKDGSITPVRSGDFNIDIPDTYTLTYTATDKAGNSDSVSRTVTVVPVWERFGPAAAAADITSLFVLGANEVPHVVQEELEGEDNQLVLRKLNTSGSLVWVGALYGQSHNGLSLAVGSDGSTLFVGTTQGIDSHNGTYFSSVDDAGWVSVGGYGLHIGTGNTPYIAAMHPTTFAMRVWRLNSGTWEVVGSDVAVPLGANGNVSDNKFYLTSDGGVYTIGSDNSDPGVSVASLSGSLWNIEKISNASGSNFKIVAAGSTPYASFSDGTDYFLYQKVGSTWSTTTMSSSGVAASSFDMAVSPSGTLYAARLEGSNVIIKRRVGSSWQNVPSTGSATAFTTTSGSYIQILPGTAWCYAIVKTSSQWIVWRISL